MRQGKAIAAAIMIGLALAAAGCGGEDEADGPPADARVSVKEFRDAFAGDTGVTLTVEDLPGGASLLVADQDGDPLNVTPREAEFLRQYGSAQIYVVEDGDPDLIFRAATGKTGQSKSARSGGDTVSIDTEVAEEPDEDGVTWTRNCVNYENQSGLDTCAWTGTKRYGQNVIVSWTQTSRGLTPEARELDEAVSAAAASDG
jgi:hypothetical protein